MRGAGIFGLRPNQILYRISPVSIGIDNYEFIQDSSDCSRLPSISSGWELRCLRFKQFVERGKSIKTNKVIENLIYPISNEIKIYYAYDEELNEKNINLLDTLEIPLSKLPLKNQTINVSMKFSNYINISVVDVETKQGNWKIIYYPS